MSREYFGISEIIAALEAIETTMERGEPFNLIILGASMPRMDDTEMFFEIRRIEEQRNIPKENREKVIMATSKSDKDTVITGMQAAYIKLSRVDWSTQDIAG